MYHLWHPLFMLRGVSDRLYGATGMVYRHYRPVVRRHRSRLYGHDLQCRTYPEDDRGPQEG